MLYYIGCKIPRGADCEDAWKCRKGEYCKPLEICSVTQENFDKGIYLYFRYNGENCSFFNSHEKAVEYLEKIRSENF